MSAVDATALSRRRDELAHELAELQWDLGGMAYEMAIRDHFRLDVLVKQAARLQVVDAELGAAERMLRMEVAGAAGTCPACGALHSHGAVYCWQCGNDLMRRGSVGAAPVPPAAPQPAGPPHLHAAAAPPAVERQVAGGVGG